MKKKKNNKTTKKTVKKRDTVRYPGLVKSVNSKVRQEYIDQDYINKLSDKEKKFLSDFNEEYYGGNFQHSGKKLHKKKERKDCYNRNNARNRCLYGIAKAGGKVIDNIVKKEESYEIEEEIIENLDSDKDLDSTQE